MEIRPHVLNWTPVGSPSKDPVTGYTIPGVPGVSRSVPCRFHSPKGAPKEFTGDDGKVTKQIGTIRINPGIEPPAIGQVVDVPGYFHGPVKDVYVGQLTTRIDV